MILNIKNQTQYNLILDTNDLKNYNINFHSFLGNTKNLNTYLKQLLENNNLIKNANLSEIQILTFNFKIFSITFSVK